MFWWLAGAMLVAVSAFLAWPLTRESKLVPLGFLLLVLIPAAGLVMYERVGTPAALAEAELDELESQDLPTLITGLEERLEDSGGDPEGWVLLGRSYKSTQQFDEAERVLTGAFEKWPTNAMIMVELAEAQLFASGNPLFSPGSVDLLDRALAADPNQQKGLWLRGLAYTQAGNDAFAIELWQRLMTQLDPSTGIAEAVSEQIGQARLRLGEPAPQLLTVPVRVEDGGLPDGLAASGTLFVIARDPQRPGPPAAVRRIDAPVFPLNIELSDSDSVMPGRTLSDLSQFELTARLSLSGQAQAQSGDWESTPVTTAVIEPETEGNEPIRLVIDQERQ